MNYFFRRAAAPLLLFCAAASGLTAQTRLDLRTQSKSADFQDAPLTRPMRSASLLPATCTANELLFLTTAPAGSNLYACISGAWVPEAASPGTVTIQNGGTSVGARQTENFIAGTGLVNVITDLGTKLNIQQSADTAVMVSRAGLQNGQTLYCRSQADTPPAYACNLSPALTAYTTGMVLHWTPSGNGTTGATTLNIDLLGAVPVLKSDGITPATGTDVIGGRMYPIWYDGTSFRMLAGDQTSGTGTSSSSTPSSIISTGAGGSTMVTTSLEWHSLLAACLSGTGPVLTWNPPPGSGTTASAAGCTGTEVNEGYAAFGVTGTPSLQTSFVLPKNLTGKVDVSIYYVATASSGAFTPTLDVYCVPSDGTIANEGSFPTSPLFAPGTVVGPVLSGGLGVVSGTALNWPTGCVGGARAHVRLSRTSGGATPTVNVSEVVLTMRRTL